MQRYKCTITYDGSLFAGYQVQPGKRTVQSEIEKALTKMHKGEYVRVTASGRTDSGVHAKGQVIHFDSPYTFPAEKWERGLNAILPDDIVVLHSSEASPDFHARFDAEGKEYRYFISRSHHKDPFRRHYVSHFPYALNETSIRQAISYLVGTHDFSSFCAANTDVKDKVRTLHEIDFYEEGDLLVFRFVGTGFLYNMVRILVGTLLEIGNGKRKAEEIPMILEKKDRGLAGKTAPAQGLYLWKVHYGDGNKSFS